MKISNLINKLNEIKAEFGDVKVTISTNCDNYKYVTRDVVNAIAIEYGPREPNITKISADISDNTRNLADLIAKDLELRSKYSSEAI